MVDNCDRFEVESAGFCKLCTAPLKPHLLKGSDSPLYHCSYLPYDGNGLSRGYIGK